MSMYDSNIKILTRLEEMQRDGINLKYRLSGRCEYDVSSVPFDSIGAARGWLHNHRGHECYISIEFEGVRSKHNAGYKFDFSKMEPEGFLYGPDELGGASTRTTISVKRQSIIRKLKALAEGTPYREEADAAMVKIRQMEEKDRATSNFSSDIDVKEYR